MDSSIDEVLETYAPDTGKPDYSTSGWIGLDDSGETAGSLVIRNHSEKLTCLIDASGATWREGDTTFDTDAITDFVGVEGAAYACSDGLTGETIDVLFLDGETTTHPGAGVSGAVVVDIEGDRVLVPADGVTEWT